MSRKPTLSPSKITTYIACPSKYRWTYVDARGTVYLRAKHYYSFGTSLHRILQRFHDQADTEVRTTSEAVAALEEGWIDAGYSSAQEMQEALGEGKQIVEAYVQAALETPTTAQALYIEKQFRSDLGEFVLIGRVDRVDEHDDGSLEIVDYKSGRSGVSDEVVHNDFAMSAYQLLLREKHPLTAIRATIYALRSGVKGTASLTEEELSTFRDDLIELGNTILNRDYDKLEPTWRDLCPTCDFLAICRKHPEFDEEFLARQREESESPPPESGTGS